jgi:cell division protein FtsB
MKKVNDLEDENVNLVAKMKDLENERDSCMERVRQL